MKRYVALTSYKPSGNVHEVSTNDRLFENMSSRILTEMFLNSNTLNPQMGRAQKRLNKEGFVYL